MQPCCSQSGVAMAHGMVGSDGFPAIEFSICHAFFRMLEHHASLPYIYSIQKREISLSIYPIDQLMGPGKIQTANTMVVKQITWPHELVYECEQKACHL